MNKIKKYTVDMMITEEELKDLKDALKAANESSIGFDSFAHEERFEVVQKLVEFYESHSIGAQ